MAAKPGLSVVDDGLGKELIIRKPRKGRHTFLEAGSVVYSAAKTKNLWQWGDTTPAGFMSKLTGAVLNANALTSNRGAVEITQGDIIIQGNADDKLLPKIRSEIQRANQLLAKDLFKEGYRK